MWTPVLLTLLMFSASVTAVVVQTASGKGSTPSEPFLRIFKDGYLRVSCIRDAMFHNGDAFGDNRYKYKLNETSGVSIVHYSAIVPKADQKSMTPIVCFDFCRTMEEMIYFGITNGRDCYCEPYFEMEASDSSDCDAVCEGDGTQMCGGQEKSTIWEMHSCNDGAVVLAVEAVKAATLQERLEALGNVAKAEATEMQQVAEQKQAAFGRIGDPAASNLMQMAKVWAGKLLHAMEAAVMIAKEFKKPIDETVLMTGLDFARNLGETRMNLEDRVSDMLGSNRSDFTSFVVAKKGDELVAQMKKTMIIAEKVYASLESLYTQISPQCTYAGFCITSGAPGTCLIDAKGCVMSHPPDTDNYANDETCVIETPPGGIEVNVESFETENGFDWLKINGVWYTAKNPTYAVAAQAGDRYGYVPRAEGWGLDYQGSPYLPDPDVLAIKKIEGHIEWISDYIFPSSGWKICPKSSKVSTAGLQYYPAMYFVDKEFKHVPQVCSGAIIGPPIFGKTYDSCAALCDRQVHDCVAFSYIADACEGSLCYLFSSLESLTYYTACNAAPTFLQRNDNQNTTMCAVKLSHFEGTTLKPDPSGKCEQCLKKIVKAERCLDFNRENDCYRAAATLDYH